MIFFFDQKAMMVETGPFCSLQRLSPSSSFKIDVKIWKRNLTCIDRTIQIFSARRNPHVVSFEGAWETMAVSAKSAQRAQFTFSTQGIVTHSQARGGEAGSQPTFSGGRGDSSKPSTEGLGLECLRKVTVSFFFAPHALAQERLRWPPFFICRIPSSCRAPAALEISSKSYSSFIFYSTL